MYNSAYNGKVNESPLLHTLSYKIASVNEKEIPFLIISYSYTMDSILSESKISQLSLFDSRTCGTMLDTEHDTWHSKRFFAPTTVTFDQPCQKIHVSSHQCFQGLHWEYRAGVQASSSPWRWSTTARRDHHYLECLLLIFFLGILKGIKKSAVEELKN